LTTYFGNTAGVGAAILTTPASYPAPLTNTFFSTSTITPPTTVVATTTQAATTAVVTAISNYIQSLLSIYQGEPLTDVTSTLQAGVNNLLSGSGF
jgi:hypothetical protein